MPTIRFLPDDAEVAVDADCTLREAAHLAGVNVHDRCGGAGSCCNCVVTVAEGAERLTPRTIVEEAAFFLAEGERLSCQCKALGDVVVRTV